MAEKSSDSSPSDVASTPHSEDRQSGNWWDTWLTSAKSKSAEVYTMVKKDLDEIGSAVKSEASHVFSTTSNVIGKTFKLDVPESPANVVKKSLSTFIGQVSTVLNPEPDDEDDTEVILSSGDTTMLSTYKKELEALQRVDATFIVPAFSPEFEAWLSSLESTEGGILTPTAAVRRLDSNPVLKAQYEKLVPDAVSHEEFWERYLFRVALLQDRLAAASRKQPIEEPSNDPVLAHLPLQTPVQQSPKKSLSGLEEEKSYDASDIDTAVAWEDDNVQATDKMNNKLTVDKKNKNGRSPKKPAKTDVCGNNLVEDYFGDKEVKDDASANSDESWEKDFEVDDVVEQKA